MWCVSLIYYIRIKYIRSILLNLINIYVILKIFPILYIFALYISILTLNIWHITNLALRLIFDEIARALSVFLSFFVDRRGGEFGGYHVRSTSAVIVDIARAIAKVSPDTYRYAETCPGHRATAQGRIRIDITASVQRCFSLFYAGRFFTLFGTR